MKAVYVKVELFIEVDKEGYYDSLPSYNSRALHPFSMFVLLFAISSNFFVHNVSVFSSAEAVVIWQNW